MSAPKNDSNAYEKVDLSLIPWDILEFSFSKTDALFDDVLSVNLNIIHKYLNGDLEVKHESLMHMLKEMMEFEGAANELAVSLGYGCVEYERNSWRKGFNSNPKRILRASLRHGVAMMRGDKYDYVNVSGYPNGNSHFGGLLANLMFACFETVKKEELPF